MLLVRFKRKPLIVLGIFFGTFLILLTYLSLFGSSVFQNALAQSDIQTVKYRNITLDLGNGITTKAQLSYPAIGKGPFPGVLLIHGSGPVDMNQTIGGGKSKLLWEISEYLSERGFAVLKYDKRGAGEGSIITDKNVWGNMTINDLIEDSKKALDVLMHQPEVDPDRLSILGHSEGTIIVPRVAIDNSTKVKNIVLMGTLAQNALDLEYFQQVVDPVEYAHQVVDENHTGLISVQQIAKDPRLSSLLYQIGKVPNPSDTEALSAALAKEFDTNDFISIDEQLKPVLIEGFKNETSNMTSLCQTQMYCQHWFQSHANLLPTLSVIGNVSKSTGILMLNGENDSQTPVEQAFLLQQRLTDVNHPDHTLITYPNLGHTFYPSPWWPTKIGPSPQYVLADLYSWLESHSGLSSPYLTPAFSNMTTTTPSGANETGSISNNMSGQRLY